MKFDPKKIMDTALDQVQQQGPGRSHHGGSEVDEILYRLSRDLEELRMKSREFNDRLSDMERQFNHLKTLIQDRSGRRY
jgi:hypothetical protein